MDSLGNAWLNNDFLLAMPACYRGFPDPDLRAGLYVFVAMEKYGIEGGFGTGCPVENERPLPGREFHILEHQVGRHAGALDFTLQRSLCCFPQTR